MAHNLITKFQESILTGSKAVSEATQRNRRRGRQNIAVINFTFIFKDSRLKMRQGTETYPLGPLVDAASDMNNDEKLNRNFEIFKFYNLDHEQRTRE
jgi:hypothetical protein